MRTGSQHHRHYYNHATCFILPQRQGSIEQNKGCMRNRTPANSQSYFSIHLSVCGLIENIERENFDGSLAKHQIHQYFTPVNKLHYNTVNADCTIHAALSYTEL